MPRVWNKRDKNVPKDAVYVGRPSKWGNPYSHLVDSRNRQVTHVPTRAAAVAAYRLWLLAHPELVAATRVELRGKDLVCWCHPFACHADVLLEVANGD